MSGEATDESKPDRRRVSTTEAIAMALDLTRNHLQLEQAAKILDLVVEAEPDNAVALNYLGILKFHLAGPQASIELLLRAAAADPAHAAVRNNMGNAYVELGDIDAAIESYRDAIRLDPALPDPYGNLASIMRSRNDLAEAERLLVEAIRLNAENGFAHHNLATLLLQTGRKKEAIAHSWKAAALIPDKSVTAPLMALAYWNAGMKQQAIDFARKWVQARPDDPQAAHVLAAFSGENVPDRAADAYVAKLFDNFAQSFDSKLEQLDYRAPQLVGDALAAFMGDRTTKLDIVDAGCGTGKCAKFLKPFARTLRGVDLSGGMLAQAKRRNLYDETEKGELTAYLEANPAAFDAVISADTLCYFGRLEEFADASFRSLRPGGVLVFTVEALGADEQQDFILSHNGRYAHKQSYIETAFHGAGFEILRCDQEKLRMEGAEPVLGLVVTAQRA